MGDPARAGVEIDVVEHRVVDQGGWTALKDMVALNLNWDGYGPERQNRQRVVPLPDGAPVQGAWHTYGVLWTEKGYTFYVDGMELWTIDEAVSRRGEAIYVTCEVEDGTLGRLHPAGRVRDAADEPDAHAGRLGPGLATRRPVRRGGVRVAARAAVALLLAAGAGACGSPSHGGGPSPIAAENALPGEPAWGMGADSSGPLQAYLDRVSARAGDTVEVKASSDGGHQVSWILYRFGWYGGAGARRVAQGGPGPVGPQPACPVEAGTGMVRCAWSTAFRISLPRDLVSGYFGVKLVRDDGWAVFAPLVVVDDRRADLVVEAAVNTWQAYNAWGGESLYADASGKLPGGLGTRVSFDRPYATQRGLGLMSRYELPFARFLERAGYDVSYTTNVDVSTGAARLSRAGAFVSVGHDEYWTGEARDAVEAARDAGTPLLFFGANAVYWKVRYEAPGAGGAPRVIACWKSTTWDPGSDPVSGPGRTGRFRDPHIGRPENALVGAMYESWLVQRFPLVVADADSWLFEGTGLGAGDALPLVTAAEYDAVAENGHQPPDTHVVARLPLVDAYGTPGAGTTVHYTAASGALVFAAGTIEWPLGRRPRLGRLRSADGADDRERHPAGGRGRRPAAAWAKGRSGTGGASRRRRGRRRGTCPPRSRAWRRRPASRCSPTARSPSRRPARSASCG